MDEHLNESSAMFFAALAEDDALRRAAVAHTAQCESCRALWQQSAQLLELLDDEAEPQPVSDALLQRTQAALSEADADARPWYQRPLPWGVVAAALCSLGLFWARLHQPISDDVAHAGGVGWRCLLFELGMGAAAFAAGVIGGRLLTRELSAVGAALAAMSGALVGQWLLASRCEAEQTALHLLAYHVAGVALSAIVGGLAGARMLSRASA